MVETSTPRESESDRYASFEVGEDGLVVYDKDEPRAWLQSDVVLALQR